MIALAPTGMRGLLRKAYAAVPMPAALSGRLIGGDGDQLRALRAYEMALADWAGETEHEKLFVVEESGTASRTVEVMALDAEEASVKVDEGEWIEGTETDWDVEVEHSDVISMRTVSGR